VSPLSTELTVLRPSAFADGDAAAQEWALTAPVVAGEVFPGRMRIIDRFGRYPAGRRKPVTGSLPSRAAAVELFDVGTGTAALVAVDLDVAAADAHTVAVQAAAISQLFRMAGLHPWTDVSPTGGRHVYAVLPHRVTHKDISALLRGLRERYPCVDTAPAAGVQGCIRPTGSAHAAGGFQRHIGTLEQLQAAVDAVPATDAWAQLCGLVPPVPHREQDPETFARPLPGTRLTGIDIGDLLHRQAVTGPRKATHVADESRFRFRVERAAIEMGFTQDEYVHAVETEWTWMARSYARKGPVACIAADHFRFAAAKPKQKHQPHTRGQSYSRNLNTSHPNTPRPLPSDPALEVRQWITFARGHARSHAFSAYQRWCLVVLGFFALSKGGIRVDGGVRAYALGAGISEGLSSEVLHTFADHGLIRRIQAARGREADTWELIVDQAAHCDPAPGWIQGLRTAFLELGHMEGEIYELLVTHGNPARGRKRRKRPTGKAIPHSAALSTAEIALRTGYSPSAIKDALAALAGWDLATYLPRRGTRPAGWIGGKADPNQISAILGTDETFEHRRQVYARQRARWWQWLAAGPHHRHKASPDELSLFDLERAAVAPDPDDWIDDYAAMPDWVQRAPADTG